MQLAVVDIESTGLKGDNAFLLCVGVKPLGGDARIFGIRELGTDKHRRYTIDKKVAVAARNEMEKYDGWITWNGILFDLPFINDRLLICGERQLEKRFARGLDMMWHAKIGKSTFQSAKLDWVSKALKCPIKKTDLDIQVWKEAEAEALRDFRYGSPYYDLVYQHNEADLPVTEFVYEKLKRRIQTVSKW